MIKLIKILRKHSIYVSVLFIIFLIPSGIFCGSLINYKKNNINILEKAKAELKNVTALRDKLNSEYSQMIHHNDSAKSDLNESEVQSGGNGLCWLIGGGFIAGIIMAIIKISMESSRRSNLTPQEIATEDWGWQNMQMICPHCQSKGSVRTKKIEQKKGISGGKATAAVLTGGASLMVTGLSRKEIATQAHCSNCNNTWFF